VILCIIVINIAIGFMQEFRSEKTLEKLRNMTAPMCKVIRDGEKQKVLSSALVPGDIVVLKEGDQVPADMRLFSSVNLECNG
jgi:P-type E1-E2 ATPase